jgi:FkbM family methyltransferase
MPSKLFLIADVLRFILNHPLNRRNKLRALGRFIRWQVGSRLAPGPVIIPFVEQTRLVARPGLMGATGIYYTGLYEFEEMAFVLHTLRPQDRFIDIGAHIGAFSVLAAGAVGADCLAIEPVPASFAHLQENLNLNGLSGKVQALNLGIAAGAGRLRFTTGKGAANGVVPPGREVASGASAVEIEVQPLDALTGRFAPHMIKIDVEGYEHAVIAGAEKTLANERLFAILIELRGHGARYGFDEEAVHQRLLADGFQPYTYTPSIARTGQGEGERGESQAEKRILTPLAGINRETGTTIYIRNLALVQQRIATAPNFFVHGQYV